MMPIKISAFLSLMLILTLALSAAGQMNRDSPFLGSKLPDADGFSVGKVPASGSSLRISEPYNSEPASDLVISGDAANTTCDTVSFQLTLTAAPGGSSGYQPVKVRVLEDRQGTPAAVAEIVVLMPATGGSVHETVGFVSDSGASGDGSNEITVVADPEREFSETDEGNNILVIVGTCPA